MGGDDARYDRQQRFFGNEGQKLIQKHKICVVGAGGLGSLAIQQAAYLGFGSIAAVDHERVDRSNLNRYVTISVDDVPIQSPDEYYPLKVDLARRLASAINPACLFTSVSHELTHRDAIEAIRNADTILGCLDSEGARLVLTEIARGLDKTYFDFASDIHTQGKLCFGGRVFVMSAESSCLYCSEELDRKEASLNLLETATNLDRSAIYGVDVLALDEKGPSVISVNGVVASLGMTELLAHVTGLRRAHALLTYRGAEGKVTVGEAPRRADYCHYCDTVRGSPQHSRYLAR